jgi:sugar/nucleoside kinase (ribokinase family)
MTDLVVATPVFLDLTFVGLEALPALGEERFAGELLRSPGGGAITAVGAVRLGLTAAVAAPLGDDVAGDLVRALLAEEGVEMIASRPAPRTPTTVVLPFGGDRAMVTVDPGVRARADDIAAAEPRAVVASLELVDMLPEQALAYITIGDDDARAYAGRPPSAECGARALFVNEKEALILTGCAAPREAAERLSACAEMVVVTLGALGALAFTEGEAIEVVGYDVGAPVDTTGAGDLFCAAYAWADLSGADVETRLRWAGLYAALSVTAPTGAAGAVTRQRLFEEGARRGLPAFDGASSPGS